MTVAAKNPNGDGSVFYEPPTVRANGRERSGRWRATYIGPDGKLRRVNAPTRSEVEARRDQRIRELQGAVPPLSRFDAESTVCDLLAWWLDTVARHQVKASTLDSYRRFAGYLSNGIGARRIVDVDSEMLAEWQSGLLDRYAPFTVLNCRKVCRQAFMEAMKLGLIQRNPFDLVKAPRAKRMTAGRALSPDGREGSGQGSARSAARCSRHPSVLSGLAGQRGARPRVGGPGPRCRHRPNPSRLCLHTVCRDGARDDQDDRSRGHPLPGPHLRRATCDSASTKQAEERDRCDSVWPTHIYDGEELSMVFTTQHGGLVNRQAVVKEIERASEEGRHRHRGDRYPHRTTDGHHRALRRRQPRPRRRRPPRRPLRHEDDRRLRPQPRTTPRRHRTQGRRAARPVRRTHEPLGEAFQVVSPDAGQFRRCPFLSVSSRALENRSVTARPLCDSARRSHAHEANRRTTPRLPHVKPRR